MPVKTRRLRVIQFLEWDDNSRVSPGRADCLKGDNDEKIPK